jgi:hypothetical protein
MEDKNEQRTGYRTGKNYQRDESGSGKKEGGMQDGHTGRKEDSVKAVRIRRK